MNKVLENSKFDEHNKSVGLLFWQTLTLWRRKIKDILMPHGITHTQYVILAVTQYLNIDRDGVSQKTISDFSMIDTMTISKTIRLLEKKELVKRVNNETDTRAKSIQLTENGEVILKTVVPLVEKVDELFFRVEEEEYHSLLILLHKLLEINS